MNQPSYWILRSENQIFITTNKVSGEIFPSGLTANSGGLKDALHIGQWQGHACYAAEFENPQNMPSGEWVTVRDLFGIGGVEAFALAGRATQLLDWQKNHRFCGRCSTPTTKKTTEFAMACPSCGLLVYPRISPAVMVLIERGDDLLLARSPNFRTGIFSALAGFVEAGETLEQCAVREVREEVGLEITNLRYYRSQPWPFPDSLMVAFFADYAGGEITPEPAEIEEAHWFPRSALPPLPDPVSIARQLIDAACQKA